MIDTDNFIFKSSNNIFSKVRINLIRLASVAVVIFSIFQFGENPIFFSIFFLFGVAMFLLVGARVIIIYNDSFRVGIDRILKIGLFEYKYEFKELVEVSVDIPDEVVELMMERTFEFKSKYRFVVLPIERVQKAFWVEIDRKKIGEIVAQLNNLIKTNSKTL